MKHTTNTKAKVTETDKAVKKVIENPDVIITKRDMSPDILNKCYQVEQLVKLRELDVFLRNITKSWGTEIIRNEQSMISYSNCDYYGLANHPEVIEVAKEALNSYGLNLSSSRITGGSTDLHTELERNIAEWLGVEDCLIYLTGYLANIGVVSALAGANDVILVDSKSHASLMDSCFLASSHGAKVVSYKSDNLTKLQEKIDEHKAHNMIIVTDGVFSMDGNTARLDLLYQIAKRNKIALLVDDAHGFGILGKSKSGTAEQYNLKGKIDLISGTFSKAIPCLGGFVAGKKEVIQYLKNVSRTFIFSLCLPPFLVVTIRKVLEIIQSDTALHQRLNSNARLLIEGVKQAGFQVGQTETSIIPVFLNDTDVTCRLTKYLEANGIFVDPVIYPAVKRKDSRIRLIVTAGHTINQLEGTVRVFQKAKAYL